MNISPVGLKTTPEGKEVASDAFLSPEGQYVI